MRKLLYATVFVLPIVFGPSFALAAVTDVKVAMQAVARIYAKYEAKTDEGDTTEWFGGSSVVFDETDTHLKLLTAAHVLRPERKIEVDDKSYLFKRTKVICQLFVNGHQSHDISCEVVWLSYDEDTVNDLAVLRFAKKDLRGYPKPKPIPLAAEDFKLRRGQMVFSCGCPNLNWPSAWLGHISSVKNRYFIFVPKPIVGRSGSAIFDINSKDVSVIGIVIWQNGTAISISDIHKRIKSKQQSAQ